MFTSLCYYDTIMIIIIMIISMYLISDFNMAMDIIFMALVISHTQTNFIPNDCVKYHSRSQI
jgi:hypothetical protein